MKPSRLFKLQSCLGALLVACSLHACEQKAASKTTNTSTVKKPEPPPGRSPDPDSHLLPLDMSRTISLVPKMDGITQQKPFTLRDGTNYMAGAVYCGLGELAAVRLTFDKGMQGAGWRPIQEKYEGESKELLKYELPPYVVIASIAPTLAADCNEGKGRIIQLTHFKRDY